MAAYKHSKPGPDFPLESKPDQEVALAFCPAGWSPVGASELALFNPVLPEFKKYQAGKGTGALKWPD